MGQQDVVDEQNNMDMVGGTLVATENLSAETSLVPCLGGYEVLTPGSSSGYIVWLWFFMSPLLKLRMEDLK